MTDQLYTLAEAAERLGLAPSTLRWQIANGRLRARKYGTVWTIEGSEIDRYARENKRQASATPIN